MKVLIVGGYGYKNVGDEAQLRGNIETLKEINPNCEITVSTPNTEYSKSVHDASFFIEALRSCFFKQNSSRRYQITQKNKKNFVRYFGNEIYKLRFLLDSLVLVIYTLFASQSIMLKIVNRKTRNLIQIIFSSDYLFFSGGGYLTEPTLSRLWDAYLHIIIAKIGNTKVIMSGQTIGPINSIFNKFLAKILFNTCQNISLRDGMRSLSQVQNLGVKKNLISVICDDATFCKSSSLLKSSNKYILYHLHYWGCSNKSDSDYVLNKNIEIVSHLISMDFHVKLISMTPSDEKAILDLYSHFTSKYIECIPFNYDIDFVLSFFQNAFVTLTMKHHPIVFSIGHLVPVISLNYSDYYEHKNVGALDLFDLGQYSISLSSDNTKIYNLIESITNKKSRKSIVSHINVHLVNKFHKRRKFLKLSFNYD